MSRIHVHVRARERKAKCRLNHFYNIYYQRKKEEDHIKYIYLLILALCTSNCQVAVHVLRLVSYVSPRNARIDNNYRASDMQVCCRLLPCPGLSRNLASDTRHQQPVIRTSLLDIILTACLGEVLSINLVISMYSCITCKFNFPCWLKGPIIMLQTAEEGRNDIQNDGAHIPAGVFIQFVPVNVSHCLVMKPSGARVCESKICARDQKQRVTVPPTSFSDDKSPGLH